MELPALLAWLTRNLRLLGIAAILVCLVTWVIDLAGWVYTCPYCRVQRTAIGIVGVVMCLPNPRIWRLRYGALAVCFLGAHVAAAQLFLVFRNLMAGQPSNPINLILATGALFILLGQALLLFTKPRGRD
ncbi:MAG TPA: hypothetical protein VLN73_05745 [Alphaproteobacteria bacterium]|nr:hypothetical protein [Alphaproteobacteria bacterium]